MNKYFLSCDQSSASTSRDPERREMSGHGLVYNNVIVLVHGAPDHLYHYVDVAGLRTHWTRSNIIYRRESRHQQHLVFQQGSPHVTWACEDFTLRERSSSYVLSPVIRVYSACP